MPLLDEGKALKEEIIMKKPVLFLLCAALCLTATGCSGSGDTEVTTLIIETEAPPEPTSTTENTTEATEETEETEKTTSAEDYEIELLLEEIRYKWRHEPNLELLLNSCKRGGKYQLDELQSISCDTQAMLIFLRTDYYDKSEEYQEYSQLFNEWYDKMGTDEYSEYSDWDFTRIMNSKRYDFGYDLEAMIEMLRDEKYVHYLLTKEYEIQAETDQEKYEALLEKWHNEPNLDKVLQSCDDSSLSGKIALMEDDQLMYDMLKDLYWDSSELAKTYSDLYNKWYAQGVQIDSILMDCKIRGYKLEDLVEVMQDDDYMQFMINNYRDVE